ncbi:MAG: autotransporter outer membrane beta-barrel domain-containing protein [Alphaproteobacteria bacterium]|nr:autotransporter outer membrane beta-barrel domain-containing protein [Alphaproteobacteria bacterium]
MSGEEDAGDVEIEVSGTTLITGEHGAAIEGRHEGGGDVRISVENTRITTSGHLTGEAHAEGIDAEAGTGSIRVTLRDVDIETFGVEGEHPGDHHEETGAHGVHASRSHGAGGVSVDIEGGRIVTYGVDSAGVVVSGAGELRLRARGATVVTHGRDAHGFHGEIREGTAGDIDMEVRDTTVTTYGDSANGVWGDARGDGTRGDVRLGVDGSAMMTGGENGHGILGTVRGGARGDVAITVQGSTITTRGGSAEAVWGTANGDGTRGDVRLDLRGSAVVTEGSMSHGILGSVRSGAQGDVTIDVQDTTVTTRGEAAYGVWGDARGGGTRGDVGIKVDGSAVTTGGRNGHGILGTVRDGAGGDVSITVEETTVTTRGQSADAVLGIVTGDDSHGDVRLDLRGSVLETGEVNSHGVVGSLRDGARGDIAIDVEHATVTTRGNSAEAVWGTATGDGTQGDVRISLDGTTVTTGGETGHGILASVRDDARGDVALSVQEATVTTTGDAAFAVWGDVHGDGTRGDVQIDMAGSAVATVGEASHGILGTVRNGAEGEVAIMLRNTTVATRGVNSDGVRALGQSDGNVTIDLLDTGIETWSTARDEKGDTWSVGVKADIGQNPRSGEGTVGDINLRMSGGSIVTHGVLSRGIQVAHASSDGLNRGDVRIATSGTRIETRGADADGILVYHTGTGRVDIRVDDGRIDAVGAGSNGIRVGQVTTPETRPGRTAATGVVERAAPIGTDGYRQQTVNVNAPVSGGTGLGAGVFLAGGGRVIVGPKGRLEAGSGVAIFSAGDSEDGGDPVPRRLQVDLRPDGLRPSDLLEGTIRNDEGETVLAVNGVSLFDSAAGGRLSSRAPNGAHNVFLAEGFAGLDFSAADSFVSVWAPRAAVYEALPGVLHRLDDRTQFSETERQLRPGQPFRLRVSGGAGSRGGTGGTVGAAYDYDRHDIEVGMDATLSEDGSLAGTLGVRRVSGSADVSAATGGGRIEALGYGVSLGITWRSEAGWYGVGRVSATRYSVDFQSDTLGDLRDGVGALVHGVELEAGRRFGLGDGMDLTPKAWIRRTALSMDGFADAAGARLTLREANRLTAGAGATVRARLEGTDGETLVLEGLIGIEGAAEGRKARVEVSRETLTARETGSRAQLGLGAAWQRDELSVRTELGRAQAISAGDVDWTGRVTVGLAF